jgi:hypothetical protein
LEEIPIIEQPVVPKGKGGVVSSIAPEQTIVMESRAFILCKGLYLFVVGDCMPVVLGEGGERTK